MEGQAVSLLVPVWMVKVTYGNWSVLAEFCSQAICVNRSVLKAVSCTSRSWDC